MNKNRPKTYTSKILFSVFGSFMQHIRNTDYLSVIKNFLFSHKNNLLTYKLAETALPFLIILTYFFLFVEVISYRGFVFKYFGIPANVSMVVALLTGTIFIWKSLVLGKTTFSKSIEIVFIFNRFFLMILLLTSHILNTFESQHFPNYVFSTFHVVLENINAAVMFGLMLLVIDLVHERYIFQKILQYKITLLQLIFLLNVSWIIIIQLQSSLTPAYIGTVDILKNPNKSEGQKFVQLMNGNAQLGWIYTYAQFLNSNIPEDATVYIPPQRVPWLMEGNPHYFRWFLYPRILRSAPMSSYEKLPDDVRFVLIATGGWPWGASELGWPKVNIPPDRINKILLIDRSTLEEQIITNAPYNYEEYQDKWGLLELQQ